MDRMEVIGAVARGWTHPDTEHLVMDEKLAWAIVDEIIALDLADETPRLGCATTAQMLEELTARAEVGGYADYRTVDS